MIRTVPFFVFLQTSILERIFDAFWMGALFGLVAYGTYDLTNLATIKNWSLKVTIIDLIWGGVLTSTVSSLSIWIMSNINSV